MTRLPREPSCLPALDLDLDDESWERDRTTRGGRGRSSGASAIRPEEAARQAGCRAPRRHRAAGADAGSHLAARAALISEAMRPSATTGSGTTLLPRRTALRSKTHSTASPWSRRRGAQDEAEVVALILREAAETPGRTAALVSPDRLLARRVADPARSLGHPRRRQRRPAVREDRAGRISRSHRRGRGAATSHRPKLMALLKHPLCRLGLDAVQGSPCSTRPGDRGVPRALPRPRARRHRSRTRKAERERVRQAHGITGAAAAVARGHGRRRDLLQRLESPSAALADLFASRSDAALREFPRAHAEGGRGAGGAAAGEDGSERPIRVGSGEAGEAAARFFAGFAIRSSPDIAISRRRLRRSLPRRWSPKESVRPSDPVHPRLFIWGPFEARLQQPDVVILGSLNEGTWPQAADPGPWLNRPMRADAGPAGAGGAHRRCGARSSPRCSARRSVYLTRAAKIDGVPTVPSRWLLRLAGPAQQASASDALAPRPAVARLGARAQRARRAGITLRAPEPRPPLRCGRASSA